MQASNGDTDIEARLMDKGAGKEGEGEANGESNMETYMLPCIKIDSQWKFAVRLRELKPELCSILEGWKGV